MVTGANGLSKVSNPKSDAAAVGAKPDSARPSVADGMARRAVEACDAGGLRRWLAHGADPDLCGESERPLAYLAAERNFVEGLRLLLDAGAHPDGARERRRDGLSPLGVAARSGRLECMELLLSRGACADGAMDPSGRRRSPPACVAAEAAQPEALRVLGRAGADMGLGDAAHFTPLMRAFQARCARSVAACLEHGADPCLPAPSGLNAAILALDSSAECMAALCAAGFDHERAGFVGESFMHCAQVDSGDGAKYFLGLLMARREVETLEAVSGAGGGPGKAAAQRI